MLNPSEILSITSTFDWIQNLRRPQSGLMHALNITARAKGMTEIAKQAGVTRASLYKSLSEDGNPQFETIAKIVEALGCKLVVS